MTVNMKNPFIEFRFRTNEEGRLLTYLRISTGMLSFTSPDSNFSFSTNYEVFFFASSFDCTDPKFPKARLDLFEEAISKEF